MAITGCTLPISMMATEDDSISHAMLHSMPLVHHSTDVINYAHKPAMHDARTVQNG
jgi:hypothetical protein